MIHPSAWKRFSRTLSQLIKCLATKGGFTRAYLYAPPQHVVPSHAAWRTSEGILWPLEGRFMHDHESELRRIPLLGTSVNKVMMHLAILLAMGNSAKLQDVSC